MTLEEKIILFDVFGTLIKEDLVRKANKERKRIIGNYEVEDEHTSKDKHYEIVRKIIKSVYNIENEKTHIKLTKNSTWLEINEKTLTTLIQTFLFYLAIRKEKPENYLIPNSLETIKKLKEKGYKIAVFSNVVRPILDYVLKPFENYIDYKLGQSMDLNEDETAKEELRNENFKKLVILKERAKDLNIELKNIVAVVGDGLRKDGIAALYLKIPFYHLNHKYANEALLKEGEKEFWDEIYNSKIKISKKDFGDWLNSKYKKIKRIEELLIYL